MSPPVSPRPPTEYDTFAGHHMRLARQAQRNIAEPLAADRNCDGVRQIVGAVLFGVFCFPCAAIRLIGSCTGCISPERITTIPGLECCSSPNPCDCSRGYDGVGYVEGQRLGAGFSRRTLDIINVITTPLIGAGIGTYVALHRD